MEVSVWTIQACIYNMFSQRQTIICANLLSNTAQALTSYVEALQDASNPTDPSPFLEEALELFQKCLEYQELQHQEFQEQAAAAAAQETDTDDGGVSLTTGSTMDIDSERSMFFPFSFKSTLRNGTFKFYPFHMFSLDLVHLNGTDSTLHSYPLGESQPIGGASFLSTSPTRG